MTNHLGKPFLSLGVAIAAFTAAFASHTASAELNDGTLGVAPTVAVGADERQTFIIGFREAPVATFQGSVDGRGSIPRRGEGRGRVDVNSPQARGHARALENRQRQTERAMSRALGREIEATHRMQHVFNGIVAELTTNEARLIAGMDDVLLVEPYREYLLDADVGPFLIEADGVWMGDALPPGLISGPGRRANPGGFQGEGVVFGIIDSGINWGSPSFSEVDMDGFRHTNPLGEGNFLGTCAEGGIDEGRCNAKLIGAYDFICTLTTICETPGLVEIRGGSDENGHGTHVASTAAGNRRLATFRGNEIEISGVAPRGNVIAYDACYTDNLGRGLCPNVSTLASINQAIADGVVDVINYSIGGGDQPWSQAISLAFLAATDAGIFVSASAGNSGPGPSTLGHLQPWVATVAAAQHGRGGFDFVAEIGGPVTPPANLERLVLTPGGSGVPFVTPIPAGTPVVLSPGIDSADDACAPFSNPALFSGAIAVVRRGGCPFTDKVNNAAAAGAVATIVADNVPGVLSPSVPGTTIPVFGITQATANAFRDFALANPGVTAGIDTAAFINSNTPDQLAGFSSRGPSPFNVLKPDVTGPGVLILAADAGGPSLDGLENLVGLKSGTSMSSPHNAGAGGLLRQVWPDWSPAEIKSALMLTAEQTVLLEDGVTAANPLAAGAGRINVSRAARSGLVLHETTENFLAANPATGGDESTLNLASLTNGRCINSCSFERTFRATRANARNWDVRLEGVPGTVSQSRFNLGASGVGTLRVTIDANSLPSNGQFNFGALVLTPRGSNNDSPELRLPISVVVPSPTIAFADPSLAFSVPAGATASAQTEIRNIGGPTLSYVVDNEGAALRTLVNNLPALGNGTRAGIVTSTGQAFFSADDFRVDNTTRLTALQTQGFTQGVAIGQGAVSLTWSIYPDAGGFPAGDPLTSPEAALWSFTSPPNGPGVTTTAASTITLDLTAAGQTVDLPPGNWWVVVYSTTTTLANNWVWRYSGQGSGARPHNLVGSAAGPVWAPNPSFAGLTLRADGQVSCGASWIVDATPAFGDLGGNAAETFTVTIDSTGLAPGAYSAFVCVNSNDPAQPNAALPVQLTVTP